MAGAPGRARETGDYEARGLTRRPRSEVGAAQDRGALSGPAGCLPHGRGAEDEVRKPSVPSPPNTYPVTR